MNYLLASNYDFNEIKNQIIQKEKLNKFIFNGQVEEYYPNDQLRFKGNYENGKRDGIFTWYYPDGSLHKRVKYKLDQWITTYEEYFHNGQLLIKGDEAGIKERYDVYGNPIK